MALISIKRNIDLQPGLNAPAVFNCSQSDKGTTIMLGLMNGGNDYTVPSGVTITIRGSRSNGAVFTPVSATSSGSTVSFTLTEEMTDTAGPTLCEAVLEQGNNVLGTANFIINVEGSPMGADVPPVFTDAAWTWMLGKLTTETVPALGDDVISSIQGKVDKSQGSTNAKKFLRVNTSGNVSLASTDKTLSVADQIADAKETGDQIRALDAEIDGVVTTLGGSISTLNGITTDLQSSKLNKNQGTSNAGKTMVVDSSGNIVPGDVPITIDDTLSIADAAADAKAAGDAIALKANASTIAPEFNDQNTYTAGSYVLKNGVLYRFTAAHSGAWTGTDVETVTVGGEVTDLKNAFISDLVSETIAGWEKGSFDTTNGANYSDNTRIRNQTKVGFSTGACRFKLATGYSTLMYAWDLNGNYVGAYKTDGTWTKDVSGWKAVTEFDLFTVPNYVIKFAVTRVPSSTAIDASEGANCVIQYYTDKTLSIENKSADAKTVGEELNKKVTANTSTQKDVTAAAIYNEDGSARVTSFVVNIKPVQDGSGTPSLNNIRQISGASGVDIFENGTTIPVSFTISGSLTTLYDANVDLITGKVTVNGVLETFTGANVNDYGATSSVPYARVTLSRLVKSGTWSNMKSNMFASTNATSDGSVYIPAYSSGNIRLYSTAFTSKAVAQSILNERPVQIYYIPATAPTIQLDEKELALVLGKNVLSTDAGRFSISYVNTLKSLIDKEINSFDSYGLSTDATLYADKLPSYYTEPETTPTSFAEAIGYMDEKISQIPQNGKSFIFITDMHWDGNKKHSVDMINYICKRTGIRKVLFGGDIYGNASNKYEAMKKAHSCMGKMKRAYGFNLISCVGDHDSNTVNVPSDSEHFLPYEQIEELFVSDLERYGEYHFYDASEKLANYVTSGSDDYNGAMAFFHTVYYVDDVRDKTRYISLNCGCGGTYGSMYDIFGTAGSSLLRLQADWLADTLMSTPVGYDVIVLSHKGNTSYAGTAATVINNILYGFKIKWSACKPYPSRAQLPNVDSWWPNNTTYDFSKAPDVGFIIAVNGHEHGDRLGWFGKIDAAVSLTDVTTIVSGSTIAQTGAGNSTQIPLIVTSCDSLGAAESTSPVMTANTVTEQCFDVITITDDAIVMTRFGAGDDRILYLG